MSKGAGELGDFTASARLVPISALAVVIGLVSSVVALLLLKLIGLCTNLFYFQRWSTELVSPAGHHLGAWSVLVPVAGALVIGLMARYGSERIRGHGIPEAIESILLNGSRVQPRLAILKPLSSAISIGSGGPFGAEGPIIMTGGAFGSMIAQLFHLSSAERKTLLVAGAAAGMSATFAAPLSAVLLAVELLLFEWKPRSLIPVALASASAGAARRYLMGLGPLFHTAAHPVFIGPAGLAGCVVAGLLAGLLSAALTRAVYVAEDSFQKLPIHWMWWPAIGGLVVGLGGLVFPQALGVGYETIGALVQGDVPKATIIGILVVKSIIWAVSLGSGTSGGVLAPLLMMGGALGGVEAMFLPAVGAGFWPLVSMGAILGGTMRSPFTGIVFALELTHDFSALLPLLVANVIAYAVTVLMMKRSILTEKVSRRGFHLSREYEVDPLEIQFVREVMRANLVAFPESETLVQIAGWFRPDHSPRGQHLFPVVDEQKRLRGVITRKDVRLWLADGDGKGRQTAGLLARRDPVVAYTDEPLRVAVYRMAESGFTRMPVVDPANGDRLAGMISLEDLLRARSRNLTEERHRERVLRIRLPFGRRAEEARQGR
ncbi:chloride channel protein [Paludibaculum fermentans]|uniref:Chloride channel protein n=1 Tax=Paludibaculum fermentans TaxID=1473598 RepID=A0A7S7NTT6_PALFE|nr:chloride channel protein [Paludibaculum fermentans]QOY89652.1 chloride channel protein [Paludibaculum fermentans]